MSCMEFYDGNVRLPDESDENGKLVHFSGIYNEMNRNRDCHFNFKGCYICIGSELQVYRFAYLTICFGQSGDALITKPYIVSTLKRSMQ